MTPITISVSEEDIAEGEPKVCNLCPIALAMRRAGLENPSAGIYFLIWGGGERSHKMSLQKDVALFMARFDDGKKCEPFTFELRDESV